MARIALDLTQFKSAGVYTIEIDQSERILVTTQSLRLVPGFSAKGPYNTPVFIRSNRDLNKFYGSLDRKLERKGSFFHRTIETCLLTSPVFALNLINIDDSPNSQDKVEFFGMGLDCSAANDASIAEEDLYVNFYDRARFWTADPDYLQTVVNNKYSATTTTAPLFQIANVGPKQISFIIRKAQGLTQYKMYAKEWYGSTLDIPYEWIRDYDYISDFFIQVIAIEGDWTNYASLALDPYYSAFFSADGIIPTQLENFINSDNITLIGAWTGCIIPDFMDKTGSEQYIETIVNATTPLTGVLMNINQTALDQLVWDSTDSRWESGETGDASAASYQVDLIGHNWIDQGDVSVRFLSYVINASDAVIHADVSAQVYPTTSTTYRSFSIDDSTAAYQITVGDLIKKSTTISGTTGIPGVTYVTAKYYDGSAYIVNTAEPAHLSDNLELKVQKFIDDASLVSYYDVIKLDGLTLTTRHTPGYDASGNASAELGVEKIYSMLEDPGIYRGLTNVDMIDYRYIVDTMAYGLKNELGGKIYLSRLAKGRGKTTAIVNAPSISHFASSTNPYFCDTYTVGTDATPTFSTAYIPQGGNPDMPRSWTFSLPTQANGSRYTGVFGPFLKYNEFGKIIEVPPAADVANAFVRKFLGGDPYAIVANKNGILTNPKIVGLEYFIDKTDRDYLEPFGYNAIIEKPATGQVMIYSNVTAYQDVKSDLNNLHVRELLNTLEIQIDAALQPYVFDFNNAVTRLNIVNSLTSILQVVKDAGALQKYEVVMDETNNTPDLIADGFGIVDVNVWVTGAVTKIINRITLNSESGVSSGGFVY